MTTKALLIYGAAGYAGRMASAQAKALGLRPILAGRDEAGLALLASELGLAHRVFALHDSAAVDRGLSDVAVLLNCAGPFMHTAEPLMKGAIRAGVHYLDVAAEMDSYRLAERLDAEARRTGVMVMPGSGGSVAMLGAWPSTPSSRWQSRTASASRCMSRAQCRGDRRSARAGT
jgi:short subunit dehydrogenase-like uncharacterized protein